MPPRDGVKNPGRKLKTATCEKSAGRQNPGDDNGGDSPRFFLGTGDQKSRSARWSGDCAIPRRRWLTGLGGTLAGDLQLQQPTRQVGVAGIDGGRRSVFDSALAGIVIEQLGLSAH